MGINLLYVTQDEAREIIKEVHSRKYGPHMNRRMLVKKGSRLGYNWFTMEGDCYAYVRWCYKYTLYPNL